MSAVSVDAVSVLLRLVGIALVLAYFFLDSVSSIFVPIVGVALFFLAAWTKRSVARNFFHMAARRGDITLMKSLLSGGYDIESKGDHGTTPLHWTAFKGHLEATRFLLESGANINARDNYGTTPLRHAQMEGHKAVEDFLSSEGGTE